MESGGQIAALFLQAGQTVALLWIARSLASYLARRGKAARPAPRSRPWSPPRALRRTPADLANRERERGIRHDPNDGAG